MNVVIFEDKKVENLFPLTHLRPVFELKSGIFSLLEKAQKAIPFGVTHFWVREELAEFVREKYPNIKVNESVQGETFFLNAKILADKLYIDIGKDEFRTDSEGELLCAYLNLQNQISKIEEVPQIQEKTLELKLINYSWDLINHNASEIEREAKEFPLGEVQSKLYPNVSLVEADKIFIGKNCTVKPGVVLDATHGAIVIDEGVEIFPNSVIEGPCYVGKNSKIKSGAKIYEGTSIGEVCKVGGEVEEAIIHAYSNKQHDGFLGHSYLAEWVNLGADTNTSDLKNDYGNVKVQVNGRNIDSGSQFVGLTMGDHSKSAINTQFNTGTVVGISSNIFGANFPPKFIPSFAWGGSEKLIEHQLTKALKTAKIVMSRRKVEMSEAYEKLFTGTFESTSDLREKTFKKLERLSKKQI
ncbi:MAG: transferase [Calditrichaeota bacterium]|nr:MAG: transferase [Calditrichota bacterium]